jgi:hypothetical protein
MMSAIGAKKAIHVKMAVRMKEVILYYV